MDFFVLYIGGEPVNEDDWDEFYEKYSDFMGVVKSNGLFKSGLPINSKAGKIVSIVGEVNVEDSTEDMPINAFMVLSGKNIDAISETMRNHPILENGGRIAIYPIKEVKL